MLREVGQIWRDSEEGGIAVALKDGNELIVLTEEEMARSDRDGAGRPRWVDESRRGIDGQGLVDAARAAIAKRKA